MTNNLKKNILIYINLLGFSAFILLLVTSLQEILEACVSMLLLSRPSIDSLRIPASDASFITYIVIFAISLAFFVRLIWAIVKNTYSYFYTRQFVKKNILRSHEKYTILNLETPQAFVFGLISPKIYLSSELLKILDDEELASVLLHEKAHIFQKDNFSQFFIKIIKDSLPQIGFLKNSFEKINSLTELACDDYVYKVMKKKRPIISSLFKLGTVEKNSLAVNFSDSSQRIIYLTKSKSINIIKDFFSNLFLIGVAIFFSLILFLQSPANACQDSSCFKKDSDEVEFKQCLVDNIRKDFRSTVMLTE